MPSITRYFGPRRGVTLHDMISDQYSHPYIQIITPHMREAHAALDAILHIVRCWDDMHRVAASLKDGTVTAVLLVDKLQALDRKNLVHRGLEEYGRILKTIDILTFISDQPYRRRVGRILNKGEAVHSLARDVAYGQLGILTDQDLASQLNRATCLSLLLNVIAVWNTRYMQAALDHPRAKGYAVQDGDLEHLSPILSGHILLHGSHHFDLQAPKKRRGQLRPLRMAEPLF